MFLTLFGEKLNGTDPEEVIRNAFGCFDSKLKGEDEKYCIYSITHCMVVTLCSLQAPSQRSTFVRS